jgi:hypothetical protein
VLKILRQVDLCTPLSRVELVGLGVVRRYQPPLSPFDRVGVVLDDPLMHLDETVGVYLARIGTGAGRRMRRAGAKEETDGHENQESSGLGEQSSN